MGLFNVEIRFVLLRCRNKLEQVSLTVLECVLPVHLLHLSAKLLIPCHESLTLVADLKSLTIVAQHELQTAVPVGVEFFLVGEEWLGLGGRGAELGLANDEADGGLLVYEHLFGLGVPGLGEEDIG